MIDRRLRRQSDWMGPISFVAGMVFMVLLDMFVTGALG